MMKRRIVLLIVFILTLISNKNYGQEKKGLVEILYDDLKLSRITGIIIVMIIGRIFI